MTVLVIDVGTSGLRAAVVRPDASRRPRRTTGRSRPARRSPVWSSSTPPSMAGRVLDVAAAASAADGPVERVGITNQRATTIVWDRATGEPVGPALGWQDLRTVVECLTLAGRARPARWRRTSRPPSSPGCSTPTTRTATATCASAPSTRWVAWALSGGALHVTDRTNAAVTGLLRPRRRDWDEHVLDALRIPAAMLPDARRLDRRVGEATALPGAPPIAALAGDQQASLVGQGCVRPGRAKITFGTGGMLDVVHRPERPPVAAQRPERHVPDRRVARGGDDHVGRRGDHAVGRHQRRVAARRPRHHRRPRPRATTSPPQCADTGGVVYVPALLGLGTPAGTTGRAARCSASPAAAGRPEVVRAVLEGVAQRGADLVDAAEADTGLHDRRRCASTAG